MTGSAIDFPKENLSQISSTIDDTIHFVIVYKIIIREFLKYYRKKYLKIKRFKDKYDLEKDFKLLIKKDILIKEEHELELELKGLNQSILNNHALQLHHNALQRKLQSRR